MSGPRFGGRLTAVVAVVVIPRGTLAMIPISLVQWWHLLINSGRTGSNRQHSAWKARPLTPADTAEILGGRQVSVASHFSQVSHFVAFYCTVSRYSRAQNRNTQGPADRIAARNLRRDQHSGFQDRNCNHPSPNLRNCGGSTDQSVRHLVPLRNANGSDPGIRTHDVRLGKPNVPLQSLAGTGLISRFCPKNEVYRWLTSR